MMTNERLEYLKQYYAGSQWNGLSQQEHVAELVAEIERARKRGIDELREATRGWRPVPTQIGPTPDGRDGFSRTDI